MFDDVVVDEVIGEVVEVGLKCKCGVKKEVVFKLCIVLLFCLMLVDMIEFDIVF